MIKFKFELTMDRLEEIALCIVHNQLDEDEAIEYVKTVIFEIQGE